MFGTRSRMALVSTVPVHIIKQETKQQKKVTLEVKGISNIAYRKEDNFFCRWDN